MATYWLSMHVPYACRHSGVCCSSGWEIPIERRRVTAIGMLRTDGTWLSPARGAPAEVAGMLTVSKTGHCVFHQDGCEIQRVLGHAALPTACQHFPREILVDPRGTFVTLSHYCPSAADLLFVDDGLVEIVEGPAALPSGEPEGLDARDVLPPVLWLGAGADQRAGTLMDLESYSVWERHMVRILTARDGGSADGALRILEADLAHLQQWRAGDGPLASHVEALARRAPTPLTPHASPSWLTEETVIRRYLAARAFASWAAYDAGGVAAVVQSLHHALSLVRNLRGQMPLKEAIRQADLQIVHLAAR